MTPNREARVLPVVTGDELLASLDLQVPLALVKLDVEGLEAQVVHGLRRTILHHKPVVLFEASGKAAATETAATLTALGYEFFYAFERRRLISRPRLLHRLYRLASGADVYFRRITHFGDEHHELLVATSTPVVS